MFPKLNVRLSMLILCCISVVIGQIEKGSLTFVIDDTGSMQSDIDQVKDGINLIFDSVMNSEDSPIEDVLLVTFNDEPKDTNFLNRTRNRDVFRQKLSEIRAHGGGDCPESCFSGIKLGLEQSRPGSFIYVFTDDVADDLQFLAQVQNLAISKKTQVTFILTRNRGCHRGNYIPEYQHYHDLAKATGGAVFRMDKIGVTQILNYVSEKVKDRKTKILSTTLSAGYGHNIAVPVDAAMKSAIISCTGENAKIGKISSPSGSEVNPTTLVTLPEVTSVKISNPEPGTYTVTAGSESESTFVAEATTTISFKYGFSPVEPTSIEDLPTLPIKGTTSHICVQIFSKDTYTPSEIILTDDSGATIQTIPLRLLKDNIYITDKIMPPDGLFKIAISGLHKESGSKVIRESETFIEVQKFSETPNNMSPKISVPEKSIKVNYGEKAKLVCNVEAYPKPNIEWKDNDGNIFAVDVMTLKEPYSYVSELVIDIATASKTYTCAASNSDGDASENIQVETVRTEYLVILKNPEDTKIGYKNRAQIYCRVDSLPPATITWHGPALKATDEFIEISDDKSVLTIKQMKPDFVGDYQCAVTNGKRSQNLHFKIDIVETKPSTSIEGSSIVNAVYNRPLFLRCRVKGYPTPKIIWKNVETGKEMRSAAFEVSAPFHYGMEMQLEKVTEDATYKCTAKNKKGGLSSFVKVVTINKEHFDVIEPPKDTTIKYKKEGEITCKVDAYPKATITWEFDGNLISNDDHYEISSDGSNLRIKDMQPSLRGYYSCTPRNVNTQKILDFSVDMSGEVLPVIDLSGNNDLKVKEKDALDINCRVIEGVPPPTISWEFQSDNDVKFQPMALTESLLHFESISRTDSGIYRCFATNSKGSDHREVYVTVEYPPTIEDEPKQVDSKDGEKTILHCKVQGYPKPDVIWSIGDRVLTDGPEFEIFGDNTLRFAASITNSGQFTCTAKNDLGEARIEILVEYYKEVTFDPPDETRINTMIGDIQRLHCEAKGYPVPTLTWEFISFEAKPGDKPKVLKTAPSPRVLDKKILSTKEEGYYVCRASNKKSEKRLTYTINVNAPVSIIPNEASKRPTRVVKGDLVRIPCQAVGKPKPSVTWMKNGYNIPTGHDSYSLDPDGALLIKGITEDGTFVCKADNGAVDYKTFKVELQDYPKETAIHGIQTLEVGESVKLECPIPHTPVDLLRWYRGSELIANGELKIDNVSHSDAAIYTCRVTHIITVKSESKSIRVAVK